MNKAALIILDGWGYKESPYGNAVISADPKHFNDLRSKNPFGLVSASGLDVGLPAGQMGNSEVGHTNIGAGRIIYQPLDQITKDLEDGTLYNKPVFQEILQVTKQSGKKLHLLGLVSDGGVHSHISHIEGILQYAKMAGLTEVYLHAFMDGRDTLPQSGKGFIERIQTFMDHNEIGKIADISGRYYAMDRDNRWDRLKLAYDVLVHGQGPKVSDAVSAMQESYDAGVNDEFVKPVIIDVNGRIEEGDTVFFFNFRPDRGREMTKALTQPDFKAFEHPELHLNYYTMVVYEDSFSGLTVVYPPTPISNTMGEYLSGLGKKQFRTAETEKYAHVTFFFNGGREEAFPGEDRVLVPSPKVATYDLQPQMSAIQVKEGFIKALEEDQHDFYLVNFANPDMVGHTGVFEAAVKAVQTVDECLGEITEVLERKGIKALVTADHGNCEEMLDEAGNIFTAHSLNPVPLLVIGEPGVEVREGGRLSDLAPTLLDLMGLEVPREMTGKSLLRR